MVGTLDLRENEDELMLCDELSDDARLWRVDGA